MRKAEPFASDYANFSMISEDTTQPGGQEGNPIAQNESFEIVIVAGRFSSNTSTIAEISTSLFVATVPVVPPTTGAPFKLMDAEVNAPITYDLKDTR